MAKFVKKSAFGVVSVMKSIASGSVHVGKTCFYILVG